MPELPHSSWERLSFEELVEYYANDPREYSEKQKEINIVLVRLVREGKVLAFRKPSGEILYQASDSVAGGD